MKDEIGSFFHYFALILFDFPYLFINNVYLCTIKLNRYVKTKYLFSVYYIVKNRFHEERNRS